MKKSELLFFLFRLSGLLCFWIILISIIILKLFFNYFTNISWWIILFPILFSLFIIVFLFLFYIIINLFGKKKE